MNIRLLSLATAVPPHAIAQRDAAAVAFEAFSDRFRDFDRLSKVFESSGIRTRYAVKPLEWYTTPLGWPERTAAFLAGASDLFVTAASSALRKAGLQAGDIDTVVTVSSTGIATPSLEARVATRMGFRPDIERIPVFGLGCAGGVTGLSIASRLAAARPGSNVLMVAVELCTLAFRLDELTKANIVATALFGDGCAACIVRAGEEGIAAIAMSGQHLWPDTLDIMGWNVDPSGFGVIFDRAIPPFARANMKSAVLDILKRAGLTIEDVGRLSFHPGGAKVVDALESAFDLGQGALNHERSVLEDYGNMSAPTAFFVLERVLENPPHRTLLTALGPGFTVSSVSLKVAA